MKMVTPPAAPAQITQAIVGGLFKDVLNTAWKRAG